MLGQDTRLSIDTKYTKIFIPIKKTFKIILRDVPLPILKRFKRQLKVPIKMNGSKARKRPLGASFLTCTEVIIGFLGKTNMM